MIMCLECNKEFKSFQALSEHIKIHNYTSQQYYDKYILNNKSCLCLNCKQNKARFYNLGKGYGRFCSIKCASSYNHEHMTEDSKAKASFTRKQTNLKRYGVEFASQNIEVANKMHNSMTELYSDEAKKKEILDKIRNTSEIKFGVSNPAKSPVIINKIKKSLIEHYGTSNFREAEEINQKIEKTNIERYGSKFPMQNKEIKEKSINTILERHDRKEIIARGRKTMLDKYGEDNPMKIGKFKNKLSETLMNKYGVNSPSKIEGFKDKLEATICEKFNVESLSEFYKISIEKNIPNNNEKYGVDYYVQSEEFKNKAKETLNKKYGVDSYFSSKEFKENVESIFIKKYGVKNISQLESTKQKVAETNLKKYGSTVSSRNESVKEKSRQTCLKRFGYTHPMKNPKFRSLIKGKYTYNDIKFDSSFYIWASDFYSNVIVHPDISFQYEYMNQKHSYHPDFIINNEVVEIKGTQFISEDGMKNPYDRNKDGLWNAKYKCMVANNVKIITDCNEFIRYTKEKLGCNFFKKCKITE